MALEFDREDYSSKIFDALYFGDDYVQSKSVAEEVINVAQLNNDLDLEFEAKMLYLQCTTFLNESENMLATYPWVLSQIDQYPNRFDEHTALWAYKWVIAALPEFPHISLEQIKVALIDMERRFMKENSNNEPVILYFKANIAELTGDINDLKYYLEKFMAVKDNPTTLGNCKACIADYIVKLHNIAEKYDEAIECASPILAKKMTCSEVPERTYPRVMMSQWYLGNAKEAKKMYQKYKRFIKSNTGQLEEVAEAISYLALSNQTTEAMDLFEQKFPYSMNRLALMDNFDYYLGALLLFGKLKHQNKSSVKLNLPETFELYTPSNEYAVDTIYAHMIAQLNDIAQKFDTRNGNNYFSERIKKNLALIG
jgi:hypothetical protein